MKDDIDEIASAVASSSTHAGKAKRKLTEALDNAQELTQSHNLGEFYAALQKMYTYYKPRMEIAKIVKVTQQQAFTWWASKPDEVHKFFGIIDSENLKSFESLRLEVPKNLRWEAVRWVHSQYATQETHDALEAQRSHVVNGILSKILLIFGGIIRVKDEGTLTRSSTGRVEYVIRALSRHVVSIVEVKRSDLFGGRLQLMMEMHAAWIENSQRLHHKPTTPILGILTTAEQWIFYSYVQLGNGQHVFKEGKRLALYPKEIQTSEIYEYIFGILMEGWVNYLQERCEASRAVQTVMDRREKELNEAKEFMENAKRAKTTDEATEAWLKYQPLIGLDPNDPFSRTDLNEWELFSQRSEADS
eukprot:TRINITY_DN3471_c0_g1_i7.p1 TRINITY_DN3471_c0_g1~~TRINITY_DN3471_c0_g1_i7.p1  ORF type:complete len:360 (+),score=65.67 TRINITY_DN3471_c0_g1_i7:532-1611(+)